MLDGAGCLQITFLLLEFSSCFDQQHRVIRYIYYSTDMSRQRIFHASALVKEKQARQELWQWGRQLHLAPQWVCPEEVSRKAWKLRQKCGNWVLQSVDRAYFISLCPSDENRHFWDSVTALLTQEKGDTHSQHSLCIQYPPLKETKSTGCISEQNKSLASTYSALNLMLVFRC